MNNTIPVTSVKIKSINLVEGEYEGFKYYKLVAETDLGFKLQSKLTEFEFNTLKTIESKRA